MPAGAGSDAFFSFGSDFSQVAQEIIDIARGLRGELDSALGGGGNIGENMFQGLIAASSKAAVDSVNNIKAAKQQIIEALQQGVEIPAGGLGGAFASEGVGRNLAQSILEPLQQLPSQIQSQILPQVENALGRLADVQARLTSRTLAESSAEVTRAAQAAGRMGDVRGVLGLPGASGNAVAGGVNAEYSRYATELNNQLAAAANAARQFAADLNANKGKLTEALRNQLSENSPLGSYALNVGGRVGFVNPDTGVPTMFSKGENPTALQQSTSDAAYKQVQQEAAAQVAQYVSALRQLVDSTVTYTSANDRALAGTMGLVDVQNEARDSILQQARAALRAAEAANGLAGADEEAAAASRRSARGGGSGPGGGGPPSSPYGPHTPQGPTDAFFGALFGQGWHAMQGFNPTMAISNLAGTAGVLLRYGGEARVLFGAIQQVKDAFQGFEQYESSLVNLNIALQATQQHQIDLNDAVSAGAQAGVDSAQSIDIGANALEAYSTNIAQGANATDVFTESVKQAGIAAVLTGESAKQASQELIAASIGFNLGPQGQGRISDAVENARRNYGGDPQAIQQAVSQAAPDAYLQGMTPEELANIAALIQRDNPGSSGSTVASLLQKLVIRGQNEQFTNAISNANEAGAGINPTADITDQIEKLSKYYNGLSESSQKAFVTQLGGARAIGALLPLLRDGADLLDKTQKSYEGGGNAAEHFYEQMGTVGGQLRQLGTLLHNISTDIGRSGIFLPIGAALELMKPGLTLLDQILRIFDELPGHAGQFAVALAEVYGLYRLINAEAVRTVFGRGVGAVRTRVANVTGSAEEGAAEGSAAAAQTGESAALNAETGAAGRAAAAKADLAAATQGEVAAERVAMTAAEQYIAVLREQVAALEAAAAAQRELLLAQEQTGQGILFESPGLSGRGAGTPIVYGTGKPGGTAILREGRGAIVGEEQAMFEGTGRGLGQEAGATLGEGVFFTPAAGAAVMGRGAGVNFLSQLNREQAAGEADAAVTRAMAAQRTILPATFGEKIGAAASSARGGLASLGELPFIASMGSRASGAAAAAGGLFRNLGSVAMTPGGLIGIPLAIEADLGMYHAVSGINRASDQSDSAQLAASTAKTVDDLTASADNLGQAAQSLRHASGGFFGSVFNALMGDPTGRQARQDESMATAQANAATALKEALDRSTSAGQAAGISLTDAKSFQNSVKWLADNGRDATTILNAAGAAMGAATTNMTGQGVPGLLLPGQVPVVAAKMADLVGRQNLLGVANTFGQRAIDSSQSSQAGDFMRGIFGNNLAGTLAATATDVSERVGRVITHGVGENIVHLVTLGHVGHFESPFTELFGHGQNEESAKNSAAEKAASTIRNLVGTDQFKNFSSDLSKKFEDELHQTGYDQGGAMTPAEVSRLKKIAEDNLTSAPWFQKLPKDVQSALLQGADAAAAKFATSTDFSNPANITQDTVSAYIDYVRQNAPQAGQEAGVQAALHGTGPQGLAQAQATLSQLQQGYNRAAAVPGTSPQKLQTLQDDIDAATLGVQQAQLAHAQVLGQFNQAQISPHDRMGQIQAQIDTVNSQLAIATDPDVITGLNAQLKQLGYQVIDQQIADANALIAASADPFSQISEAQSQVAQAQNTYDTLAANGASGSDLSNAQADLNNKKAAAVQAQVQDANDMLEAMAPIGNTYAEDMAKAAGLLSEAANTHDPGKQALLQKNAKELQSQAKQWQDQANTAMAIANLDPRDVLGAAQLQLTGDQQLLKDIPKGDTQARAAQIEKIKNDRLAVRKDNVDIANAESEASVFPGSQLEAAHAKLVEARRNLSLDLKGSEQYYRDLAALHSAQVDLANSQIDAADVARQLSIDLTDPVAVARDAVQKAQDTLNKALAEGAPADVINADRVNLIQQQNQAERTAFEQRLQDAQTNAELGRTSYAAYVQYLESEHNRLVAIGHRTRQQQEELNEVDQALKSVASAAGGQFNLGQITVPTVYQARRTLAQQTGTGVYDYNPIATGTAFGMGQDPATAAATAVLDPVAQSIQGLSPVALKANESLTTLAATLGIIAELEHDFGGKGGSTHIEINGADMGAVLNMLSTVFGVSVKGSRATNTNRKA